MLLVAWALGGRPGWGTVANAVLIGLFVELLTSVGWIERLAHDALGVRVGLVLFGLVLFGVGTAFYIGAALGAGPRDTLMLVGARRSGQRIGLVRGALELVALGGGIVLGGTFGVGTIAFALGIGPAVELGFAGLRRSPFAEHAPPRGTEPPFRNGSDDLVTGL